MSAARFILETVTNPDRGLGGEIVHLDFREGELFFRDRATLGTLQINLAFPTAFIVLPDRNAPNNCGRIEFPPVFDGEGRPVNYNSDIVVRGAGNVDDEPANANNVTVRRTYYVPELPDPNEPQQR